MANKIGKGVFMLLAAVAFLVGGGYVVALSPALPVQILAWTAMIFGSLSIVSAIWEMVA